MCGRFTQMYTWEELYKVLNFLGQPVEFKPNYNVAPTQLAPVVRNIDGEKRIDLLRWGLIPSWAKELSIGNRLINARADSVASKPSFRAAFKQRRCLVPASGFYEWVKIIGETRKQPFYIRPVADEPFLFAGLWERWQPESGEAVESFTIITTEANPLIGKLHERMPVILSRSDLDLWLDPKTSTEALQKLLVPCSPDLMKLFPVSTRVNSPAFNSAECISPATDVPESIRELVG